MYCRQNFVDQQMSRKYFLGLGRRLLLFLNLFLISFETDLECYKRSLKFSSTTVPGTLEGLLRKNRLAEMLGTSSYASIDMSNPFLRAVNIIAVRGRHQNLFFPAKLT